MGSQRVGHAPWTVAHQIPLSSTVSRSLLKFISVESVMLSNHLTLCFPLLPPSPTLCDQSLCRLSNFTFTHWRRKWQPTPVFLPGESQGQGSLVGCRLWGRTESDMTEATKQQQQQYIYMESRKMVLMNLFAGQE